METNTRAVFDLTPELLSCSSSLSIALHHGRGEMKEPRWEGLAGAGVGGGVNEREPLWRSVGQEMSSWCCDQWCVQVVMRCQETGSDRAARSSFYLLPVQRKRRVCVSKTAAGLFTCRPSVLLLPQHLAKKKKGKSFEVDVGGCRQ